MTFLDQYTTLQECLWVRDLAIRNPAALAKYAAIVRGGYRKFDDGIDVWVVLRTLDEIAPEVKG